MSKWKVTKLISRDRTDTFARQQYSEKKKEKADASPSQYPKDFEPMPFYKNIWCRNAMTST